MSAPTPFFVRAGEPARRGRLLLISWHFPPGQSAGALRWQKMAAFFSAQGWQLDVITSSVGSEGEADLRRLDELPPGTRVFVTAPHDRVAMRIDRWRARRLARSSGHVSTPRADPPRVASLPKSDLESVAPEDIRWRFDSTGLRRAWNAYLAYSRDAAWGDAALALGRVLLGPEHRAVVSCGPPHPPHEAARVLAREAGLPFAMDLRDPWALRRRLPAAAASPLTFALADALERRCVSAAALVVANTDALAAGMAHRYPGSRVITVMNGFDDEPLPVVPKRARFTLAYAGAVYLDRDPSPLFEAVARVVRARQLESADIGLEFIGPSSSFGGVAIHALAERAGIARFVEVGGRVPRAEALAFLASAHMLVSLPQDSAYAIPSKIFEYMRFPAWLLVMAGVGSPAAALLEGRGADVVPPDDAAAIAARIDARYGEWRAGAVPAPLSRHRELSRESQATELVAALETLLGADGR